MVKPIIQMDLENPGVTVGKNLTPTDVTDAGGVTAVLTTKGDIVGYSTLRARLAVGTNSQVLTAASGEATGLKWNTLAISARAEARLDLSGAAQSAVIILHTTRALTIVKLIALYTEASSGDAGVAIKVGKESDDDYYYTGTSIVSKSLWDEDDLTLLNADIAAGDTVVCSNAGGKTGTGEILFVIEYTVD